MTARAIGPYFDRLWRGPPIYISGASPPQWPTARRYPRRLVPRHQSFWAALSPCRYHPSPRPGRRKPVPWPRSGGPISTQTGSAARHTRLRTSREHKNAASVHSSGWVAKRPRVAKGPLPVARAARRATLSNASASARAAGAAGRTAPPNMAILHALLASSRRRRWCTARTLLLKSTEHIGQALPTTNCFIETILPRR